METKQGFAVQITRKDGTTFMASGEGNVTPVWTPHNRKYAVEYKRMLVRNKFMAKVVPVEYTEPRVIAKPTA